MTEAFLFGMAAGVALVTLGAGFRQGLRDRAMRRRFGNHSLVALQKASQELGLPMPHLKQFDVFASRGTIEGVAAEVSATVWGQLQVSIKCKLVGLPAGVGLVPNPTQEDLMGGEGLEFTKTGFADFDRNFAVWSEPSPNEPPPAIPLELLQLVAERFDPLTKLMVWGEGVLLLMPPQKTPNWIVAQMHLQRLWRSAERLLKDAHARGLIQPAS